MRDDPSSRPAVVLLSGGLDSATTLAIARAAGFSCFALSFDYGQRHRFEVEAAKRVAPSIGVAEHRVVTIDLRAFGGSALTDDIEVPKDRLKSDSKARGLQSPGFEESIPITYVPARNTIFLSFALGWAEVLGATDIFLGVNAIDSSGYPDCRPGFIAAFEKLANLATKMGVEGGRIRIHAPLITMTKAQIIQRGIELGVEYRLTHSCYDPDPKSGAPCGHCDSCFLRAEGFRALGMQDPAG